jgi:hypothetical protein
LFNTTVDVKQKLVYIKMHNRRQVRDTLDLTDFFHFRVADYGYTKLKDLFEAFAKQLLLKVTYGF